MTEPNSVFITTFELKVKLSLDEKEQTQIYPTYTSIKYDKDVLLVIIIQSFELHYFCSSQILFEVFLSEKLELDYYYPLLEK